MSSEPIPATADPATADPAAALGVSTDDAGLRRFLHGLPSVDEVGAQARADALATRSIKTTAKVYGLDLAIRVIDLTTLEGADTVGTVRNLCTKAVHPVPVPAEGEPPCPRVAAVCVYNDLVPVAVEALTRLGARAPGGEGSGRVNVAAVATAFPSGRASRRVKLADTQDAVLAGADEVDMVIDRGAFLSGNYAQVFEEIVAVREACASGRAPGQEAHLKVILETGELGGYDRVRRASWLAMLAGADFIKTSTGKVSPAATPPVSLVMLEAVRDWYAATGRVVGFKPAGGIRTAKDALRHLVLVQETAGPEWLTPDRYRIGASGLLNDVLLQRRKLATGAYASPIHLTPAT